MDMDVPGCWQLPILREGDRLRSDWVNSVPLSRLSFHMLSAREIKTDGLVITFAIYEPVSADEWNNSYAFHC